MKGSDNINAAKPPTLLLLLGLIVLGIGTEINRISVKACLMPGKVAYGQTFLYAGFMVYLIKLMLDPVFRPSILTRSGQWVLLTTLWIAGLYQNIIDTECNPDHLGLTIMVAGVGLIVFSEALPIASACINWFLNRCKSGLSGRTRRK